MDKETLKQQILQLNSPDYPFEYAVNGDSITGYWNWTDGKWFMPGTVTEEQKEYSFTVNLLDNKTYSEYEKHAEGFKEEQTKSLQGIMSKIGIENEEDKKVATRGFAGQNTNDIKGPLRDFLKRNGWSKAGFLSGLLSKLSPKK
jgi:hypothetical protein